MLLPRSIHPLPGEAERRERLLAIVDRFPNRRILVIGDLIADEFIYGEVARVSREAPVLILRYDATRLVAGGAGNAANNVSALGGRARLVGLVGGDIEGRRLLTSFHGRVDRTHVIRARGYRTPIKTRILAGGVHAARQQVVRIDRDNDWPFDESVSAALMRKVGPLLEDCDAVLLSDYGSGLITPRLADAIRRGVGRRVRRRPVPVLLDSRYRLIDFRGLTTCTPNESEVEAVLITRGSRGMALFEAKQRTVHIPIFGSDEVADVTGAGDTVIATFALALSAGASFYEAARLANYAGGLVVMKRGTATVSATELSEAVRSDHQTRIDQL